MNAKSMLRNEAVHVRQKLSREIEALIGAFPTEEFIARFDAHDDIGHYKCRSPQFVAYCQKIRSAAPDQASVYNAVILLELIERSLVKIGRMQLPADVEHLCLQNFARILSNISSSDVAYMQLASDRFDKDLAAASLRLICAGAQKLHLVYLGKSLPRRAPFAWARCVWQGGLYAKVYEMHTDSNDPTLMADFNEPGWRRFYLRTAALLSTTDVAGVIGTSWFFDPALKAISPRLAYLRSLVMDNGGFSIRIGTAASDIESATRTSQTRRSLYESGKYRPVAHTLLWFKRDLIQWAKRQDSSHSLASPL